MGAAVRRPARPIRAAVDVRGDGVTSISLDLHKYAYAPKGTSVLLHRTPALRRPQFFASARWPGYTMVNTTTQSTKSGGPLAGAWAVVNSIGDAGYLELARKALEAVDEIVAGIERIDALRVVAGPESTLMAVATDGAATSSPSSTRWPGRVARPAADVLRGQTPPIHLSVSAATAEHVGEFLQELEKAVAGAIETGPLEVPPEIVELVRRSTRTSSPRRTSTACSPGSDSGDVRLVSLPEAMAPINALLDLAAPALREALLTAFLDRLLRPSAL